jgi:hypothetical protein
MKTGLSKSVTMKLDVKTTPYFAAYPLKALNLSPQASTDSDKNNIQKKKMARRLRISPMINPYTEKKTSINKIKIPKIIQPADNKWFNNYE